MTNGMEEPDEPFEPVKRCCRPLKILFEQYCFSMGERRPGVILSRPGSLRILANKPLVVRLTKDIIQTYHICNPRFMYAEIFNPKRYLTKPSTGVLNDGLDNVSSDYILTVNAVLVNSDSNCRYVVKDLLGQGTFGQVAKCWSNETNSFVAVKVIKNQPAYYHQALVEVSILTTLNKKFDTEDKHHIVRMCDHFVFHGHLCIVFEMLGPNLYELIKTNQFRGISLNLLKLFAKQILDSLLVLRDASVIHCDLKPENILLTTSIHSAEIKLIDFGSACTENQTIYSYIQSRFYRSPEVVLGHPYTTAIDMWSFGCIAAELFLGLPLFPGASEYDLMKRMVERLGGQPPDQILRTARNSSKYFKYVANGWVDENQAGKEVQSAYQLLSESEYELREKKKLESGKRYFNYVRLEDIIFHYPHRKKLTKEELAKENQIRLSFIDFLRGLVHFDPVKRWTPRQAAQHPFVTEEPFTGPYRPFPEAPHMHVFHEIMVDDNPGSSHWFGNSFPQGVNTNAYIHYSSPQRLPTKFNHTSSCGSLGSYGIHGEGFGLTNNCGCQGDTHIPGIYCPLNASTFKCQEDGVPGVSCVGESPKTWHRKMPVSHEHALGVSPSNCMLRPMSFGFSPSQFPSSFQVRFSPASPGKQGLTSPASGDIHGTALGRAAAVGPYHKIRGLGMLENLHLSSEEDIMSQCKVNHQSYDSGNADMCCFSSLNCNSQAGYLGNPFRGHDPPLLQPWRQRFGIGSNTGLAVGYDKKTQAFNPSFPKRDFLTTQGMCSSGGEKLFPASDLKARDPNYSNDLNFQRDGSDITPISRLGESIQSRQAPYLATSYAVGACRAVQKYIPLQGSPANISNVYRPNGLMEGQNNIEDRATSVYASQLGYTHLRTTNPHLGCIRPQQNSPSQIGLQSSLFSKQQLQHAYHAQNNPGQHLPSSITGKQQTYYPTDLYSESTYLAYSHYPVSNDHGCSMPSQRDSQAFYGQSPDFVSASNRIHEVSGISSFVPLRTMASHLVNLGQRNQIGTLPASVHGIQDH